MQDDRTFRFGVNEYKNFDDLRAWFLNYGRRTGIIKIKPLEERKRRGFIPTKNAGN